MPIHDLEEVESEDGCKAVARGKGKGLGMTTVRAMVWLSEVGNKDDLPVTRRLLISRGCASVLGVTFKTICGKRSASELDAVRGAAKDSGEKYMRQPSCFSFSSLNATDGSNVVQLHWEKPLPPSALLIGSSGVQSNHQPPF